jgi:protein with PEP-CTERM/exosortase system signal
MKTLILAAIRCSLMFTAVTASLFAVQPAQAYTVTLLQVGSDVVATGSGPIDLTDLTFSASGDNTSFIFPKGAAVLTGPTGFGNVAEYGPIGNLSGPTSFGSGDFPTVPGSGDFVGINAGTTFLLLPASYISGNALSDSMTFNNATFASLGVTPGTYVWTWGTGANQKFTLRIGAAALPDAGSTVSLLSFALIGLGALRRKLSC